MSDWSVVKEEPSDWDVVSEDWDVVSEERIGPRRGGTRAEFKPYVAGAGTRREDGSYVMPAGIRPSNVQGGRGNIIPEPVKPVQPFRDKREALDDAVDRIESGADPAKVFDSFKRIGVTRDEIIARGRELGGPAFADQRPSLQRTPQEQQAYAAMPQGEIKNLRREGGGILSGAGDIAAQGAGGVVSGVRMLADAFPTRDTKLQKGLESASQWIDGLRSAASKQDEELIGDIMGKAADQGVGAQIKAAAKAFSISPGELIANGLGTSVTTILAMLLPGVRESTIASLATAGTVGAVQAAGAVRGDIFNTVRDELMAQGMSRQEAEDRAEAAQSYTGQNARDIAIAAGLGALASTTGVERIAHGSIRRVLGKKALEATESRAIPAAFKGGLTEAVPEFAQGAQGQYAQNVALQREGFEIDPMRGVVGAGALEAAAGAGAGAAVGAASTIGVPRPAIPKVEDMPADRVLTPEEVGLNPPPVNGAGVNPPQGQAPSPVSPSVAPAPPSVVPTAPSGSLAAKARVATGAQDAGQSTDAAPGTGVLGAQGSDQSAGSVGTAGRGADATGSTVAPAPVAAGQQAQAGSTAGGSDVPVLDKLRNTYESRRQSWMAKRDEALKAEQEFRATGLTKLADEQRAKALMYESMAGRIPNLNPVTDEAKRSSFERLADVMEQQFGRRPTAYWDDAPGAADGFVDRAEDAFFVNLAQPEISVAWVAAHEFRHLMRSQAAAGNANAKKAEEMLDVVWAMISPEGKKTYAEKYLFEGDATIDQVLADPKKLDLLKEEMLADFMGKRFTEARFMRKLAKREPEKFGDFVKQWIDTLRKLIDSLKGMVAPEDNKKDIDRYIKKLKQAEDIAVEVAVEWAKTNPKLVEAANLEADIANWEGEGGLYQSASQLVEDKKADSKKSEKTDDKQDGEEESPEQVLRRLPADQRKALDAIAKMKGLKPTEVVEEARAGGWGDDYIDLYDELSLQREANAELEMERRALANEPDEPDDFPPIDMSALDVIEGDTSEDTLEAFLQAQPKPEPSADQETQDALTLSLLNGDNADARLSDAELAAKYGNWSNDDIRSAVQDAIDQYGYRAEQGLPNLVFRKEGKRFVAFGIDGSKYIAKMRGNEWEGEVIFKDGKGWSWADETMSPRTVRQMLNNAHKSQLLNIAKFDIATTITEDQREALLEQWAAIASRKAAFSMPDGGWSKNFTEIGAKFGEPVRADGNASGYYLQLSGGNVSVIRDYKNLYHANTVQLQPGSKSGSLVYPLLFTWARNNGNVLRADPTLSYVNTYRRTEQMLSAGLRLGSTEFMRPGWQQRVYGWMNEPKTQRDHDDNIVRLALASARNAREVTDLPDDIEFSAEDGQFVMNGRSAVALVRDALGDRLARGSGVGPSTLARALITESALQDPDGTLDNLASSVSKVEEVIPGKGESSILYSRRSRNTLAGGRFRYTIPEMVEQAQSMSSWKDWYARHEQALGELFGGDRELFEKLLAATSQAASVPTNVSLALKAYRQFYSGEPFDGFLPAVIRNLERLRAEEAVRGAKISEYDKANAGDPEGVPVDRHIAELMFNTQRPNRTQIKAAQRRMRELAERLGWEPRQVQSALWAYNQVRKGLDPSRVQSYDTILNRRAAEVIETRRLIDAFRGNTSLASGPRGNASRRFGLQSAQDRARTRYVEGGELGIRREGEELDLRFSSRQSEYADLSTAPEDRYSQWGDRSVTYEVRVADTGDIATLTVKAAQAARMLDSRAEVFRNLISCLKR